MAAPERLLSREFREGYREYNDNALAGSNNNRCGISEVFVGQRHDSVSPVERVE